MLLKYFYDEHLAQASYLIGCVDAGTALVIDPARHVQPYIDAANAEELRIVAVAETHIHADYISGSHELAYQTGATLYLSAMGEGDLAYDFAQDVQVQHMHEGDVLKIGNVCIQVMFTPGHTPEHISFQVTDTGQPQPVGIFTGDFLFVGDVGRPDLLEEAVKIANTKEIGARQQYANVQRFQDMADYLQIWPGHGAGSACGKALGAIPSTTLGYEKLVNPAFQQPDEAAFTSWLLQGQPEPPHYFARMKAVNRVGAPLLDTLEMPVQGDEQRLLMVLSDINTLVIDTRDTEDFAAAHLKGTVNIPFSSKNFCTYVGWYVDYERPTYVIAEERHLPQVMNALRAIGVDDVPAYFTPEITHKYDAQISQIEVHEAFRRQQEDYLLIVDVRGHNERDEQHIPGSMFMPMGQVPDRMGELPPDEPVMLQCGGGVRSQVVASILEKHGYKVLNLAGGIDAWIEAGLPIVRG